MYTCFAIGNRPIYKAIHYEIQQYISAIFLNTYYTLKYKKPFRRWLWELVRERNAMRKYSPENLAMLLDDVDDAEDALFHEKLNCW
jgi:hypothetical protein